MRLCRSVMGDLACVYVYFFALMTSCGIASYVQVLEQSSNSGHVEANTTDAPADGDGYMVSIDDAPRASM